MLDWEVAEAEWLSGVSNREIGRRHGISESSVLRRARLEGWDHPAGASPSASQGASPGGASDDDEVAFPEAAEASVEAHVSVDKGSYWHERLGQFVPYRIVPPFCCGFCGFLSDDPSKMEPPHRCAGKLAFMGLKR